MNTNAIKNTLNEFKNSIYYHFNQNKLYFTRNNLEDFFSANDFHEFHNFVQLRKKYLKKNNPITENNQDLHNCLLDLSFYYREPRYREPLIGTLVRNSHSKLLNYMLDIDPNIKNTLKLATSDGFNPYHSRTESSETTALSIALEHSNIETIKIILNLHQHYKLSRLELSKTMKSINAVAELVINSQHIKINQEDLNNSLCVAVYNNQNNLVELLLKKGADPNYNGMFFNDPYHDDAGALFHSIANKEILKKVIKYGFKLVEFIDKDDRKNGISELKYEIISNHGEDFYDELLRDSCYKDFKDIPLENNKSTKKIKI